MRVLSLHSLLGALFVIAGSVQGQQADDKGVRHGQFPSKWITGGPKCAEVPDWQVQEYNDDLYIIRESGCTDPEKPFLYLFFGKNRALLEDTGSGHPETSREITALTSRWLRHNHRESIPLVVTHSHSHEDHVAGDSQLASLPNVTMVPLSVEGLQKAFSIAKWPEDIGKIDLGDRVIDIIPIPGHDSLSIALYDRQTGILFTGDSLYPGRVFVRDVDAFTKSNQRMVDFTRGKVVTHILGCHVEQTTTPYLDYPVGTTFAPEEHALPLSRAHLLEMNDALKEMKGSRERYPLAEFTIWPLDENHPFPASIPPPAP